jgi:hypothetical protein
MEGKRDYCYLFLFSKYILLLLLWKTRIETGAERQIETDGEEGRQTKIQRYTIRQTDRQKKT